MKSGRLQRVFLSIVSATSVVVLVACATGLTNHSFSFDARWDSPDVEVLDYQYGNSKQPGARPPEYSRREGKVRQYVGITGDMLRGDFLYVKWRIKKTGEVYEDTVDLKSRLPADIMSHLIHFVIQDTRLYVYLISPERLNPNPCPSPDELRRLRKSEAPYDKVFSMYCYRKITTLYPDQTKQ